MTNINKNKIKELRHFNYLKKFSRKLPYNALNTLITKQYHPFSNIGDSNSPHFYNHLIIKSFKKALTKISIKDNSRLSLIKTNHVYHTFAKAKTLIEFTIESHGQIYVVLPKDSNTHDLLPNHKQILFFTNWRPGFLTNTSFRKNILPSLIILLDNKFLTSILKETTSQQIPTISFTNIYDQPSTYPILTNRKFTNDFLINFICQIVKSTQQKKVIENIE